MEKKKYEVRVAYVVYDYFNVVAESEDEAKDMAKEIADTHSLNDFQLQDTTCTIESAEPYDGEDVDDELGDGEFFNGFLRIHFKYREKNYSFRIDPELAEVDNDIEDLWNYRLHPHGEDNITFVLIGHYIEVDKLSTDAPLMIRVEDADEGESYIDDIDIF